MVLFVECETCGSPIPVYPRDSRIYKSGEEIGYNGCITCNSRIEVTISLKAIKRED